MLVIIQNNYNRLLMFTACQLSSKSILQQAKDSGLLEIYSQSCRKWLVSEVRCDSAFIPALPPYVKLNE
jgi:hypothetical protein